MKALEGKSEIELFRLMTLNKMLELEIAGMHRHGVSAYSMIKKELGLKGSRDVVKKNLELLINKRKGELNVV